MAKAAEIKRGNKEERVQNKNLIPVKPGEVRNPKGRGKGVLNYKTRIELAASVLAEKLVAQHNKKNPKNKITIDDVDILGDIFEQYVTTARTGKNDRVLLHFIEMTYPKKHVHEHFGAISAETLEEQKAAQQQAEDEIDSWQNMWVDDEPVTKKKQDEKDRKTNKGANKKGSRK